MQFMEKKQTVGLEGMEFYAYHGFYDEEQKIGTVYWVDVHVTTKDNKLSEDNLENTVNYEIIYAIVKKIMSEKSKLIEHLAEKIILELKKKIKVENTIKVQIKKMNPPISGNINNASVSIEF